jgi:hypothetical protein
MAINSVIFSGLGEVAGMLEGSCEVLIRKKAQVEWAEKQIQEKAEQLARNYIAAILRGFDPAIVRGEFTEQMAEYCAYFLPMMYQGATLYLMLQA